MSATLHTLGSARAPSLDPMIQLVAADLNHVNAVILERMQSPVALIPELAGHLIAGGGKRMRPMLTLACARLLDYPGSVITQEGKSVVATWADPALWDALRRLYELWPDPGSLLWRAGTAGAFVAAAVLVAAMHCGVVHGRTDDTLAEHVGEELTPERAARAATGDPDLGGIKAKPRHQLDGIAEAEGDAFHHGAREVA